MIDKLNKCKFLRDSSVEYKAALALLLLLLKLPSFLDGESQSALLTFRLFSCFVVGRFCFALVHAIYFSLGRIHQPLI